ncbi:hypothetical protein HYV85_05435 [Candidatus Woesearchaeota archaeon]|nr:hypothetical protein [Candidatus Woesearchaeota archaeon]
MDGRNVMDAVLGEIKDAEKEADGIVEEAEKQKQKIISDSRMNAAQFLKAREAELAEGKAQAIERQKEKIAAGRGKILGEGMSELRSMRKNAEKRANVAINLVLEAFEKEILQMR